MSTALANTSGAGVVNFRQRDPDATVWVGGLDDQANEELLWELMIQFGMIVSLVMPRDSVTGKHQGYCFVEYETPDDADYALRVANGLRLYGKVLPVNKAMKEDKATRDSQDWMVRLFVGNLASEVNEKMLSDLFNNFGALLSCSIAQDADTGRSKCYAFITFDTFESGDAAIHTQNGQFFCNRQIVVNYAFKQDGKTRHGDETERMMATKAKQKNLSVLSLHGNMPIGVQTQGSDLSSLLHNTSNLTGVAAVTTNRIEMNPPPPPQGMMMMPPPPPQGMMMMPPPPPQGMMAPQQYY